MRKHGDPDTGMVCLVTITRREWRRMRRARRRVDRRGRAYLRVQCPVRGRVLVRAFIVVDGAPEARPTKARR